MHTDSLTVYKTDLNVISTEEGEGAEVRRPVVQATAVVEQRISHFVMGLAIVGTMTGPLLVVLHTMPVGVLGGVFFIVGVSIINTTIARSPTLESARILNTNFSALVGLYRIEWYPS